MNPTLLDREKVNEFQKRLASWWATSGRHSLPWRLTDNLYFILVAEFLLQKTDASKAQTAYRRFIEKYPNIRALAEADETELTEMFKPIGLYYRAPRMKATSKAILEKYGEEIPKDIEALRTLPGVGDYIANAVLCMGDRQRRPLIDTNTARVLGRVWNFPLSERPRTDKHLWAFAESLLPQYGAREYNLALLDLAQTVCTPKKPAQLQCPVADICEYYRNEADNNE